MARSLLWAGTVAAFVAATSGVWAHHADDPATGHATVTVSAPWTRATPGAAGNAAVYCELANAGAAADRLIGAETDAAARAELHGHTVQDGVMRMNKVDAIAVPAGGRAALAPGGFHLMLIGLKAPLEEGDAVAVTLRFETAGAIAIMVPVLGVGALGPPPAHPANH